MSDTTNMTTPLFSVAEIFTSINGEGQRAGTLAVFVRLCGCNLHCSYCDTMWANLPDAPCTKMTAAEILHAVRNTGAKCVTLTGGEPLLHPHCDQLLACLLEDGTRSVEIETNGSIPIAPFLHTAHRAAFTLDYKLPDSGMEAHMCLAENAPLLTMQDTVKFVAGSVSDLNRAYEITKTYDLTNRCAVFLSPVFGKIEPSDMVDFMVKKQWNDVRLQLQLHKFIWDPQERGV